jgi:hypothetical protein
MTVGKDASALKREQVIAALKREKELLEQMLDLAECQPELVRSGRVEDLEILLSLRANPLSEMTALEEVAEVEMEPAPTVSTDELQELNELNLSILSLVDRIVGLDEKTDWLADECASTSSTKTQA